MGNGREAAKSRKLIELFEQRFCLFQIARVEALGEPAVHRSQ
jgi:hypothetical protein